MYYYCFGFRSLALTPITGKISTATVSRVSVKSESERTSLPHRALLKPTKTLSY